MNCCIARENGESLGISKGDLQEAIYRFWWLELVIDYLGRDWSEFVNLVARRVSDRIFRTEHLSSCSDTVRSVCGFIF